MNREERAGTATERQEEKIEVLCHKRDYFHSNRFWKKKMSFYPSTSSSNSLCEVDREQAGTAWVDRVRVGNLPEFWTIHSVTVIRIVKVMMSKIGRAHV